MPQEIQRGLPAALAFGLDDDAGSIGCGRAAGLDTGPFRYVAAARERKKPPGLLLSGFGCLAPGPFTRMACRALPSHVLAPREANPGVATFYAASRLIGSRPETSILIPDGCIQSGLST